jgi:hypothetical protein
MSMEEANLPPPPDQEELEGVAQLARMGFEPAAAARALRATGGNPGLLNSPCGSARTLAA